jgi:hypothetical protein
LGNTPHWGNTLNAGHLGDVSEAEKRPDQETFCIDLHWIAQVQDLLDRDSFLVMMIIQFTQ